MNSNAKHIMKYGKVIPLNDVIDRVNRITRENVNLLAKNILDETSCSVALVGNLDKKVVKGIEERWNQ